MRNSSPSRQSGQHLVGETLHNVPLPSAILDLAKIRQNTKLMLDTVRDLQVGFRAHVKTHKTTELTRYQVGHDCKDVRLIVSTVLELEQLVPLVKDYQTLGASVNVLYGIPVGASYVHRLAEVAKELGAGTISLMIDSVSQLESVRRIWQTTNQRIKVFLKTDSGYHRAGLAPTSTAMAQLVLVCIALEKSGMLEILGFYTHNSLSYGGSSPDEAMDNLRVEIDACTEVSLKNLPAQYLRARSKPIVISSGASPTALSMQNLSSSVSESANKLKQSLETARSHNLSFEIHAGVYPVLDMQQVSAASRSAEAAELRRGEDMHDRIALTILTEVCSLYPDRTDKPEALVNAGGLALARESCKDYRGHGVISPWNMARDYDARNQPERIIVDRVSQEHGIIQWEDASKTLDLPLRYGQRVRLWPNHACITGAQYPYYLIVDSDDTDPEIVKSVWKRWSGW